MNLTATSRSIPGTLRQEIIIDGKHRLITDEPVEVGGDGSAPAPHELLPSRTRILRLDHAGHVRPPQDWDLGEVRVDVSYDHRATPRRADITISIGADLSTEQRELLEKVAAACPVRRSIETEFEFNEQIVSAGDLAVSA